MSSDSNITNIVYNEYFNIIRMEYELFNSIITQQQTTHRNLNSILSNYQNYILYPSILAENRERARQNEREAQRERERETEILRERDDFYRRTRENIRRAGSRSSNHLCHACERRRRNQRNRNYNTPTTSSNIDIETNIPDILTSDSSNNITQYFFGIQSVYLSYKQKIISNIYFVFILNMF